jgi:acetyl esterase
MKTIQKVLKYSSIAILGAIAILAIYTYSLTYSPHGCMMWQQAAYAKFFHKMLNIQTDQIAGLLENDLKTMKPKELLPAVGSFETIKITADSLPLHIYKPEGLMPNTPIVIYYHGGGFMFPYLSDSHIMARKYANAFQCVVIGVDYRVTPKYSFPIPINDSYNAFKWIVTNGARFGGNPDKIAVIGESAGGNISAVVAQNAMRDGYKNIKHQTLFCPTTDAAHMHDYPSFKNLQEGYVLDRKVIDYFFDLYLPNQVDRPNPEASPLLSENLAGLPPAFIITAEFDPIKDEGKAYYEKLKKAGVQAKYKELKGVLHVAQGPLMEDYMDKLNAEIAAELKFTLR